MKDNMLDRLEDIAKPVCLALLLPCAVYSLFYGNRIVGLALLLIFVGTILNDGPKGTKRREH